MAYISVIVPVYNAEKTIERCVNSIIGQTFSDLEIILIDDGSKDSSGELCDALAQKDDRITVCHKINEGVSAARNSGIGLAKGEYIQFVDSDDYIPKYYCEQLVDAQKRFDEDAFVWTGVRIVSENGAVAEQNIRYSDSECDTLRRKDVLKLSVKSLLNAPYNKLYHASIIHENHLRMKETISIAEDLLFNLEYLDLAGQCPITILNDVTYFYVRNGETSLDHGYRPRYYEIHKEVLGKLWQYCKDWQVPEADIPLFYKRYWEYMQAALYNLNVAKERLSSFAKFCIRSKITANNHFQKSLKQKKEAMGRGTYFAWRSRIYFFVWLYEKIRKRG